MPTKQRLNLSVRHLTKPSAGAFDTRPRAVTRWAAELPMAHLDETGQRLCHALAEVNGLDLSIRRRTHLLETLGPKARLVLDHLRRRYASQSLPLTPAAEGAARQAIALLSELLRGYRTLLGQIITTGKPLPPWHRLRFGRPVRCALHRFIHYGGELLALYEAIHRAAPDGLWKRVNRCYLLAEAHGMAGSRLPLPGEERRRTRVQEEYLRALLMSLLPVDGITPAQWGDIIAHLPRWIALTALVRAPFAANDAMHVVRLGRDGGPQPVGALDEEGLASPHTRGICITGLRAELQRRLARGGRRRLWRRETDLAPEALQFLVEYWCSAAQRTEQRDLRNRPADVIIGLATLHHLLGGNSTAPQEEQDPEPTRPTMSLVPEPELTGHHMGTRAEAIDIWQSVYVDPEKVCPVAPVVADWRRQAKTGETYRSLPARLVDRSQHGCGVHMDRRAIVNVATGMLIALREEENEVWHVGVITRVTAHGEQVALGARLAGEAPLPAHLHTRSARGLSTFPAIVARDEKGRRLLIAPAVPAVREGELMVELGGHRVPLQRLGNGTHSRHVAVVPIAPLRADDERHFERAPVMAVAAAREEAWAPQASGATDATPQAPPGRHVEQLMAATGIRREDAEFFLAAEAAHKAGTAPRLKSVS
ncbi:MAG: hypothetical protein WDA11_12455 [Thiohalomonadaceae bacterium]